MKLFSKFAIGAAAAAVLSIAGAANAVVAPFGGASTGVDPLGNSWVANNAFGSAWGEPGLGLGEIGFNSLGVNNNAGTWANRLSFIFLEGVSGAVDQTAGNGDFLDTRFYDGTTNQYWNKLFVGNDKVVFTAPSGSKISQGDQFFVNVHFTGPVDPATFSFAGLWTDAAPGGVPEPATWALMMMGFGLIGLTARGRRMGAQAA